MFRVELSSFDTTDGDMVKPRDIEKLETKSCIVIAKFEEVADHIVFKDVWFRSVWSCFQFTNVFVITVVFNQSDLIWL